MGEIFLFMHVLFRKYLMSLRRLRQDSAFGYKPPVQKKYFLLQNMGSTVVPVVLFFWGGAVLTLNRRQGSVATAKTRVRVKDFAV